MSANNNGCDHMAAHDKDKKQSPASSTTAVLLSASSNGRPACFNSTTHEVLFVLTTTMAVSMTSLWPVQQWSSHHPLAMTCT
jgi:hypothetical protein